MGGVELFVAVAVVTAVAFSLLADPAADEARRARRPPGLRRQARQLRPDSTGAVMAGRLLFARRIGTRTVGLDCLLAAVAPGRGTGPVAVPVHVTARCAMTWWAAERFLSLLEKWARGDTTATVDLVAYRDELRVRVCCGESCLILDVQNAAELRAAVWGPVAA